MGHMITRISRELYESIRLAQEQAAKNVRGKISFVEMSRQYAKEHDAGHNPVIFGVIKDGRYKRRFI